MHLQVLFIMNIFESLNLNLNDVIINKTTKFLWLVIGTVISHGYTNWNIFIIHRFSSSKRPREVSYVKAKYNAADVITCLNSILY
jgi:hypothetical protein